MELPVAPGRPPARRALRRALVWASGAVVLLAAPSAALVVGLWLWKREVAFGPDGWRYRYHVAGTPLARFPVVAPLGEPVFTQRATSGYGTALGLSYTTAAPLPALRAALAAACPDEPWAAATAADRPAPADDPGRASYACGPVLFRLTPAADGIAVRADLIE